MNMAEKRRDSKNRVLKTGESQRKDGRYMYKYTDMDGKVKYEYSWKLVPTDKMPAGKKDEPCLRDKIKEVEKRLENGLVGRGGNMTVRELVEESLRAKSVQRWTMKTYRSRVNCHIFNDEIAGKVASEVRKVDVREYVKRMGNKGLKRSSIMEVLNMFIGAYNYGIEEELVRRNPFQRAAAKDVGKASEKVEALTPVQKESFLRFVRKDKCASKYVDEIELLFETGLRISELSGLTFGNVDMKKRILHITQQRYRDGDVGAPKSKAGIRDIPMSEKAYLCLKRLEDKQAEERGTLSPEEYVVHNRDGKATSSSIWSKRFDAMEKRWGKADPENACRITPHVCRHTYCTELIRAGVNLKAVQYLMGHTEISVTMNTYSSNNNRDDAVKELSRVGIFH